MTRNDFEARIKAEIRRCMAVASKRWPEKTFPFPTIKWNNRKTATTAGTAYGPTWTLKFATKMLMDNPDEIEETAAHEYGHLVDYRINDNDFRYVYKTRSKNKTSVPSWKIEECPPYLRRSWFKQQGIVRDVHGEHFKNIMRLFGKSEARCHTMKPVARKTTKRYRYSCSCDKGCAVGPKHNKMIQNGTGRVNCRRCKTYLSPRLFETVLVGNRQDGWKPPVGYKTRVTVARRPSTQKVTKTVTRKPKMPRPGTKMAKAVELVRHWNLPRKPMTVVLMQELSMSRAGAQTYYYNARKVLK